MRTLWTSLVAVVLVLLSVTHSPAAAARKKYQVEIVVNRGDPLGSRQEGTLKVYARPTLIGVEGREMSMQTGGEVTVGGDTLFDGFAVRITPVPSDDGKIQLKVVLEQSEVGEKKENQAVVQVSQALYHRAVQAGEVIRLRFAKGAKSATDQLWVELSVSEVAPGQ